MKKRSGEMKMNLMMKLNVTRTHYPEEYLGNFPRLKMVNLFFLTVSGTRKYGVFY